MSEAGIDYIVVLTYVYDGVCIIDQAVGASYPDGGRDVVLEVDGTSEAGLLEVRVGESLDGWRSS